MPAGEHFTRGRVLQKEAIGLTAVDEDALVGRVDNLQELVIRHTLLDFTVAVSE